MAQQLLAPFAGQEVRLIIDGSKVGFGHQLLMVAVAYRRRSLPLAWCWVNVKRGHSSYQKQLALLAYVRTLLPPDTGVLLVGDGEFGGILVLRQLEAWRWHYVLRQKSNNLVQTAPGQAWLPFGKLVTAREQLYWWPQASLTHSHCHRTSLLAYWRRGEDDPWLLATNLHTARLSLQAYRRRMWIEEMFGDMKGHGFDLEATHLRHFLRLSRLTLAVCLLYVWLVAFGSFVIKSGQRHLVDRTDRRDLSIFRIGWDTIERRLALGKHAFVSFRFYL